MAASHLPPLLGNTPARPDVVVGPHDDLATGCAQGVRGGGRSALTYVARVGDKVSAEGRPFFFAPVPASVSEHNGLDVLVNNAAVGLPRAAGEGTPSVVREKTWERALMLERQTEGISEGEGRQKRRSRLDRDSIATPFTPGYCCTAAWERDYAIGRTTTWVD